MKYFHLVLFFSLPMFLYSQKQESVKTTDLVWTPEFMAGILSKPNKNFVEHGMQTRLNLHLGWQHDKNPSEWARRLKGPRTGFSLGYANFGNKDSLGSAYTLMPFLEFKIFKSNAFKMRLGMGASYFTKKFDSVFNPNNQGVSTDLTWSFKAFMYYRFLQGDHLNWHLGLGYYHHSNGHSRLPNQGFNSFLFSLSTDIKNSGNNNYKKFESQQAGLSKSHYSYMAFRTGIGKNVLSKAFNTREGVYSFSGEFGKVYNNTYILGLGFYYRYYQNYFDYIENNEQLVREGEEFEDFKDNPWLSASNFGFSIKGELLLNHIGIEGQLGLNLHKPAYDIAWRITEGLSYLPREFPDDAILGEFNTKYKLKKHISTRLGLKAYLFGMNKPVRNNLYLAFHINTNLGQADFNEISLGYVHAFIPKKVK